MNAAAIIYASVFAVSGVACLAAVPRARRFDDPAIQRGLVGLLVTTGIWALFKVAFFTVPDQFRRAAYIIGLVSGFATVWAWLYFCSAYTGRNYHRNTTLRRLGAGVFLSVVAVKSTNPFHGLYFTTSRATTPFEYTAIDHGVLHWSATALSYVLAAVGMFMIYELFIDSGYDTRSLSVLTGLLGLPVVLDIAAQLTPQLVDVIYAPLGVAVFSLGVLFVFQEPFLAVQSTAETDNRSIYLDDSGRIRDYSPAAAELFPALESSRGERLDEVVPDVASAAGREDRILEHEEGDERQYYFVSTTTVTLGDSSVRVLALSDVTETERKRRVLRERERELAEQNELSNAIIDASFAFVFRMDLEGRFSYVSPSVEEFLGYSAQELEGAPITVTHPDPETTEWAWNQLEQVMDGEPNEVRDFPLETGSGRTIYTDVRAVPIYDGSRPADERTPEDITAIQLMVRDTTERRRREGLISVINRVLRHNVRNEMNVVSGYAAMLRSELDGDRAEEAALIEETADRLLELSESARLIEENREPSPDLEAVDLAPIIDRVLAQLETQYPDARVTSSVPDEAIAETRPRLETALRELVENAAKHGGDPASVDVDVTVGETDVAITIADDGPGLPDTEREVLEAGKETPLAHGQGLGLWLAYWLVDALEGRLDVTEYEDGTTVEVRLPRSA